MKMYMKSVFVDDQSKALEFYTKKLEFVVKEDFPAGDFRWITLVSAEELDGVQLCLEPNHHPAARAYQRALFEDGIPCTAFGVSSIADEVARLRSVGVEIISSSSAELGTSHAVFSDTCGNLIEMVELEM